MISNNSSGEIADRDADNASSGPAGTEPPGISLPKGGGAIRGIGEKFAANPVTGSGSMSVPIAVSPGRGGFNPELTLSYDSGAGNGPFGFGWTLGLPSISRKTDKGLPLYRDAIAEESESDTFILSGAEDLVPILNQSDQREVDENSVPGFRIHRYRPRIEGLFARIERWTNSSDPSDVHWRTISRDNVLTIYGKDDNSRITDPLHKEKTFQWLICETRDDKGNAILYDYKKEDGADLSLSLASERNRGAQDDPGRTAQRYLKRIFYGNRLPTLDRTAPLIPGNDHWHFEVVFDYGEHDLKSPLPDDLGEWDFRTDPFSTYRPGFEIRTTRFCQRVLMFHHFEGVTEIGKDYLVRSTDFTHSHQQDPASTRNPIYTFLKKATQTGYQRDTSGVYQKRSLPPVEFTYSEPFVKDEVEVVDSASLENLPIGVDGATYQWTDLHGEGIPGILTEQADAWFYKRNLSPAGNRPVEFSPLERVASKPNFALAGGAQFMDLAGNGKPDLVMLDGPAPGFFEHDEAEDWQSFRPFTSRLNRDTRDPNLKMVDLNGDGHADILITEDDALVWHSSEAEKGFGKARRVAQALDEEKGPRLVFADGTQSIFLSDLSGDGLTDLVRIRNGEVCYWPNLGYARFGAKVTMDNAPHFDHPDQFDHQRLRLADIDGSGTIDLIYLHRDGVRLYFNQSGNGWSQSQILKVFPRIDDLASIATTDLLGNGTACLVWNSSLPADAGQPMRYVNLMGDQKPHLLIKTINNLGAETHVQYAPSTKFYLQDKQAGKPWITKLPFPVHVVEKVTVTDKWQQTSFSTRSTYHHGYFDGVEREFRGFGRVEQIDSEAYGEFAVANAASDNITNDQTLYQPPVKTVTWYHTGAVTDRERILSQFETEYFPHWFEEKAMDSINVLGGFQENALPEPVIEPSDLTTTEWREALRACKGMPLRQEVYELDVEALKEGRHEPVKLFSAAYHNCHLRRLQPMEDNRHSVFLATESEAITYQYELDLRPATLTPDPRISHTLNLKIDELGNVLQSVAAVYPRIRDNEIETPDPNLINRIQKERHLAYTETRFTNDAVNNPHHHRLSLPCEVLTYELAGINPGADFYFSLADFLSLELSDRHPIGAAPSLPVADLPYHVMVTHTEPQKRLVEQVRMLFFKDDLKNPLPFGTLNSLALPFETYTLAMTRELLDAVIGDSKLTPEIKTDLNLASKSGYLSEGDLSGRYEDIASDSGQYWIRSGIAGFADDANDHFYLPERYTDPFGITTTLSYDSRDLFIQSSEDPLGNTISVEHFDYRVLAPREIKDINNNLTETQFDILGLPTLVAVKGKGTEADNLLNITDDLLNPPFSTRHAFFTGDFDEGKARELLGNATARHLYDFGEEEAADGTISYEHRPAGAAAILREKHSLDDDGNPQDSDLQVAFEYSDGHGNVFVTKNQAEPETDGGPLRWIANGKTILNNKGKPVRQYEPYFTDSHTYAEPLIKGVTPVMYYDAPGRLVRTELPDGTFSRVEFSPWHVTSFDPTDTVLEADNDWFRRRSDPTHLDFPIYGTPENERAAKIAEKHANTPAIVFLDSLGRDVVSMEHNRVPDDSVPLRNVPVLERPWLDEKYLTYTKLDAEGKPLWIRDARGNRVMQYISPPKPNGQPTDPNATFVPCYDIAGNLLFQNSMDGGDRWMITDATGQPFYAWDKNEYADPATGTLAPEDRVYHTRYDELRRPSEQELRINGGPANIIERFIYGESHSQAVEHNLRGQVHQHFDSSGLMAFQEFDFKGNPLKIERTLAVFSEESLIDWSTDPAGILEVETFTQETRHDALNRMTSQKNWHLAGSQPAIYTPEYNQRGLLSGETLQVRNTFTRAIDRIEYDPKGQRTLIKHGNNTTTRYQYDDETFRLKHLKTTLPTPNDAPKVLQDLSYTYDPVGNITTIRDDAYHPTFFNNQQVDAVSQYCYDALYRLVEATGREKITANPNPPKAGKQSAMPEVPGGSFPTDETLRNYTQRYRYDSVGNIQRMRHVAGPGSWTRNYDYAADSNRLEQTSMNGSEPNPIDYQYDTHGSILNLNNKADEFKLRWDRNDMIHHLNLGGGGDAHYRYGSDKERTRKRIVKNGGVTEERFYLGGMEIFRKRNSSGTLLEEIETHHLFDGEQRILIVEDVLKSGSDQLTNDTTLLKYQYSNHLGSAGLEADQNGNIISYEEYHPYGTTAYSARDSEIKTTRKRYRFTGMERDGESGLSYHSARYYLPWLGRWGSVDPAGLVDGGNLFNYVNCNPVMTADSNGKEGRVFGLGWFDWDQKEPDAPVREMTKNAFPKKEAVTVFDNADNNLIYKDILDIPQTATSARTSHTAASGTFVQEAMEGAFIINRPIPLRPITVKISDIIIDVTGYVSLPKSHTSSEIGNLISELNTNENRNVNIHFKYGNKISSISKDLNNTSGDPLPDIVREKLAPGRFPDLPKSISKKIQKQLLRSFGKSFTMALTASSPIFTVLALSESENTTEQIFLGTSVAAEVAGASIYLTGEAAKLSSVYVTEGAIASNMGLRMLGAVALPLMFYAQFKTLAEHGRMMDNFRRSNVYKNSTSTQKAVMETGLNPMFGGGF